jgi:hypothetical protein
MTITRSRVTASALLELTTRFSPALFLSLCLFLTQALGGGDLPDGWWKQCKARPIKDYKEYTSLVAGELKDKYIFVDTYMERCPYCYYCLEDFN